MHVLETLKIPGNLGSVQQMNSSTKKLIHKNKNSPDSEIKLIILGPKK
jgi:hypothetical protein